MTEGANYPVSVGADGEALQRERRELLIFKAGARSLCLFADETYSAVEWRAPAPLPRAPQAVLGVVSLRGRIFTLLDSHALFVEAKDESAAGPPSYAFIIALRGDEQLALAASTETRAAEIFLDQLEPAPPDESRAPIARALFRDEGGETSILLDTRELFARAMRGAERRRRRF